METKTTNEGEHTLLDDLYWYATLPLQVLGALAERLMLQRMAAGLNVFTMRRP